MPVPTYGTPEVSEETYRDQRAEVGEERSRWDQGFGVATPRAAAFLVVTAFIGLVAYSPRPVWSDPALKVSTDSTAELLFSLSNECVSVTHLRVGFARGR